ncbi:MAG TPA: AzlC family ABC transporter permease, partial [Thermodesulfobacteriota bacterium]|nr:AzlC family ABC transporter permease [Thermodesulfobacteriota bacterium]
LRTARARSRAATLARLGRVLEAQAPADRLAGRPPPPYRACVTSPSGPSRDPFWAGVRAAVPVWIAFVPTSFALGLAAKGYGLALGEILLMSALVYAGPAQFAALEPLGTGKPAAQVLLATVLINLRFVAMSAALAPYFRGVRRAALLAASQLLSASSFVLASAHAARHAGGGRVADLPSRDRLRYFVGAGGSSFLVWVAGSGVGYGTALAVPAGFEEGLRFLLPGYFAAMLAVELRGAARLVGLGSFLLAFPAVSASPGWGWLAGAVVAATAGFGIERWIRDGWR